MVADETPAEEHRTAADDRLIALHAGTPLADETPAEEHRSAADDWLIAC